MKRCWLGTGILVAILTLGVLTTVGMTRICEPISAELSSAAELAQAGQLDRAVALSRKARDRWEKWYRLTASVTDHEPMDEVDALFEAMEVYAKAGDALHFSDCCARLSAFTDAVGDAQAIYWWSIL